jgi:hypothetical protein
VLLSQTFVAAKSRFNAKEFIGVSTKPGATALAHTPLGAHSGANDFVR